MTTYERNENVEFGEQVLRGGVSLIMLQTVLLTPALSPLAIAGLSLAAIYVAFTAITGWDPVYAAVRGLQPSLAVSGASIEAFPARETAVGYKKAA